MPNTPNPDQLAALQAAAQGWVNNRQSQQQVTAAKPPEGNDPADVVKNMPNSERLTASERWLYGKLPGFSQSTVGQALAKFGDSWAGKALNYLDVGAEGIERTVGLFAQIANQKPGEELDLKSAWYAGSLTGDMINLPTFKKDENGKVIGIQIPGDLPGVNGLVRARKKIYEYVSQGMDEREALTKVRDDYYNDLGALSLRAQLYDTYFHMVGDPLNYIMPALKPVEALQARRIGALTGKIAYSAEELASFANKAQNAADIAKAAGKLEDAANYANEATKLTELVGKLGTGEVKQLDALDKFAIMLTGGDPLSAPKGKIANFVTKPFPLTPQSKAQELLTMVNNNISTKIIARLWDDPDAVNQIANAISRASKGATGAEYGHAFLTTEGRTVQGFLGGADAVIDQIRQDFNALERERGTLEVLRNALQDTPENILKLADENPQVLFKMLSEKAAMDPVASQLLQQGEFTPDKLNQLAQIMKDVPYDKETAIVHMMGALEEHAARQAIIQFGVEKNSLLTRWSNAIKSAESLAFMRINPGYALRNAINNEVTGIARGVFGVMGEAEIKSFWTDQGFIPKRIADAFTAEGEKLATGKGERVISEATKVDGGLPERIQKSLQDIQLGKGNKLDVTKYSQAMEQSASRRYMTKGYMQFFQKFWKPPTIENALDGATMDAIDAIDNTLAGTLNDAIKASYGSKKKFYEIVGKNLNLNPESVMKSASDMIGMDVKEIFDDEIIATLNSKLPEAIESGNVEKFVLEMQSQINDHVDEMFNKTVQDIVENVAAQVQAGGPQMFYRKVSDAQDAFWGAHIEHSISSPHQWQAYRDARSAKDWARANSIAERNIANDERFFARSFKRVDAYLEGLEKGAVNAEIPFPKEVRQGFKDFQNNWRDFFSWRNGEYKKIGQLPAQERRAAFDKLQREINNRYKTAIDFEDEVMQRADDAVANLITDPAQKRTFMNYRDQMAKLTRKDKDTVVKMFERLQGANPDERARVLNEFWTTRKERFDELRQTDRAGLVAMQGNPEAAAVFEQQLAQSAQPVQPGANNGSNIFQIANEYGIPSATDNGTRNDKRILAAVNKYLPEGQPKFTKLEDVPEDIARQAFANRETAKGEYLATIRNKAPERPYIMDVKSVVPDLPPIDIGLSELSQRQSIALDAIIEAATQQAQKTPAMIKDLPPELQKKIMGFVDSLDDEFSSAKLAATKYGEFRRDSALLNYSRRTNFDTAVATVFPFAFWTTHSVGKWAVESIDRPAMLTSYLRIKKMLETAGAPQQGFPSRFKDNIRIHLPFAPSWMGDQFIDPLKLALPFDAFMQPVEQYQKQQLTIEGRGERVLDTLLQDGKINQQQYDEAMQNHAGPAWDLAKNQAIQNDDELKMDVWDFANLMSSPHAPLQWAYLAARGEADQIGPFSPMARTSRQVAELMGVDDYVNSPWNVEGKIRKHLGLPAFDKWEDYRIDREISNFGGTGEYTVKEVKEAMVISSLVAQGKLSHDQAMENPVYAAAVDRKDTSYTSGKAGALLGLIGINVKSYPEGEMNLRALQDDFGAAWEKYHKADQSLDKFVAAHPNMEQKDAADLWEKLNPALAKDSDALTKFFDDHPEYEQRLGLWDKPEERLKKFMVDSMWAQWNSLPKLTKDELKTQLGDTFENAFVNKETRSYDAMTLEQMQVYLKLMGGKETPGMLTADQRLLTDLFSGNLKTTDPETAWRAQVFYDQRQAQFKNYYDLQKGYYDLKSKGQQRAYIQQHPELKQYWDWRREFLNNNPDIVPYLTDNPKDIQKAQKAKRNEFSVPQAQEIQANISPAAQNLLASYAQTGDMAPEVQNYLEVVADSYGLSPQQLYGILGLPAQQ